MAAVSVKTARRFINETLFRFVLTQPWGSATLRNPQSRIGHRTKRGAGRGMAMELLSTRGLPEIGRAAAWGEIYATRMSQCEFTPGDKSRFDAELRIDQLGPVKLARLTVDKCSVERKRSHIVRNAPRLFNFLLQAEGESIFYHCGKESRLQAGDR